MKHIPFRIHCIGGDEARAGPAFLEQPAAERGDACARVVQRAVDREEEFERGVLAALRRRRDLDVRGDVRRNDVQHELDVGRFQHRDMVVRLQTTHAGDVAVETFETVDVLGVEHQAGAGGSGHGGVLRCRRRPVAGQSSVGAAQRPSGMSGGAAAGTVSRCRPGIRVA